MPGETHGSTTACTMPASLVLAEGNIIAVQPHAEDYQGDVEDNSKIIVDEVYLIDPRAQRAVPRIETRRCSVGNLELRYPMG